MTQQRINQERIQETDNCSNDELLILTSLQGSERRELWVSSSEEEMKLLKSMTKCHEFYYRIIKDGKRWTERNKSGEGERLQYNDRREKRTRF